MKRRLSLWVLLTIIAASTLPAKPAFAGPHFLSGTITNITSNRTGIAIMLNTGVPDNCAGVGFNWITVAKEDETMIALLLTVYYSGDKQVTVYTDAMGGTGVCHVNQLDPTN